MSSTPINRMSFGQTTPSWTVSPSSKRQARARRTAGASRRRMLNARRAVAQGHRLQLVGQATTRSVSEVAHQIGQPMKGPSDPRWVLAIRTADLLEGDVLSPQKRKKLLKLGKILNLTPFDANMIIAIVQDQARRGYAPAFCPTASEPQLRMIPLPTRPKFDRFPLYVAGLITVVLLVELVAIRWLLL